MKPAIALMLAAGFLAAGCETKQVVEEKPDPRLGKEVAQICFTSQIRSWQPLGDRAVTVEVGVKDNYRLALAGTCRPQDAFTTIGLVSRGGGQCLSRGDELVTDQRYLGGKCFITRINEWDRKPAEN